MDILLGAVFAIALLALIFVLLTLPNKKPVAGKPIPVAYRLILAEHVPFYQALGNDRQREFEERVQQFLGKVRITGVNTTIEDLDRVLVAASAIIPIFNFPGWEYVQLNEVLIYPGSFNHDFVQEGPDRNIAGMVGNGPLHRSMILSQADLREGFLNKSGKHNTGIHEFVHLVDKTDGSTDGLPEFILSRHYLKPWLQLMHREIRNIMESKSDIDSYGATSEAEFFAVVSEYFFERPDLLREKHPGLYDMLLRIFGQQPDQ
jgi:Mlc titration factor MtfA (ptsG expression regulator)